MECFEQLEHVLPYFEWDFLTFSRLSKVSWLWHHIIKKFYQNLRKQQRQYISMEYKSKYSWFQSYLFPTGVLCREVKDNSAAVAHTRRIPSILTGNIDDYKYNQYKMIYRLDCIYRDDNHMGPLPCNYHWSSRINIHNEEDAIKDTDAIFRLLELNWPQDTFIHNDIIITHLGNYWSTPSGEKVFLEMDAVVPDNYMFLERIENRSENKI